MRVSRKCLKRILSTPLLPQLSEEPGKVSRTASSYSEFCSQKKRERERRNRSKTPSSADREPRGPRAICIPVCGCLRDTDDKLGSQCCAPTWGRWDGSLPSLSSKEGPWQHPGHSHTILQGPGHNAEASPHPLQGARRSQLLLPSFVLSSLGGVGDFSLT